MKKTTTRTTTRPSFYFTCASLCLPRSSESGGFMSINHASIYLSIHPSMSTSEDRAALTDKAVQARVVEGDIRTVGRMAWSPSGACTCRRRQGTCLGPPERRGRRRSRLRRLFFRRTNDPGGCRQRQQMSNISEEGALEELYASSEERTAWPPSNGRAHAGAARALMLAGADTSLLDAM